MIPIVDLDFVKYSVASVGEERYIEVVHNESGNKAEFKTRTEFWGHHGKKGGGYLADLNEGLEEEDKWTPDDFTIVDKQRRTEDIKNILYSAKTVVDKATSNAGGNIYNAKYFLGKGDSFRVKLSTLLEYKGNRKNLLKPLALDDVSNYLKSKYNPTIVTDLEADDACVIEACKATNRVIVGVDKDYYGCPVNFYNHNRPDEGVIDCRGLGELYLDSKKKVRGKGLLFFLFQVCSGDSSDNYKANCFSDKKWGDKAAYGELLSCKNEAEAWEAAKNIFQLLYPESKEVTGWRGDKFDINWAYVMQEMVDMAYMKQSYEDTGIRIFDKFDELGIKYE